ncbi:uncharacterized protein LOC108038532 [Drosophila rhopaloa]|uniref:Uncharacterized protein LOC108038532 n=1 Tax=Drosophila rhopaloa TaxID=1041015 RepID=A0A6P4E336_DRORH|nr:uncharacterized protein LOC108038532 [Drosophila rhopaloa]
MDLIYFLLWQALILLKIVNPSFEINYEYVFEDEDVFSKCQDKPPGFLDVDKLFDLSLMHFEMHPDGLHITGNLTTWWDVEPTDRIEGSLNILHLDRGTWQPTILNLKVRDFCKIFYDPKQFWYTSFAKYIINNEDALTKCFNNKGTVYYLEPYIMKAYAGTGMTMPSGRNRMILTLVAVDENNVKRPNGICTEIMGEFVKVK